MLGGDDLAFLATETFEGDGDAVGMVPGGAFAGSPGADANAGEVVTAADVTGILAILDAR